MRFSDILHYVQNNKEKKKRIEKAVQLVKNQLREMLDALPYPDAVFFTSRLVNYLNTYLDERSPVEVYRSIASWEFDESRKPYCICATLDPNAFKGVDRSSQTANIIILIERVANGHMPKGKVLKAKLTKRDMIELTGSEDIKATAIKRCMNAMQAQQRVLLDRKSRMH